VRKRIPNLCFAKNNSRLYEAPKEIRRFVEWFVLTRKSLNLSRVKMGNLLGISEHTIKRIEQGGGLPTDLMVWTMCKKTNQSPVSVLCLLEDAKSCWVSWKESGNENKKIKLQLDLSETCDTCADVPLDWQDEIKVNLD
jgi:transcriptional regulator with XRE-family HTH domain